MERKEVDQANAVQVLMTVQQKKIESAAIAAEARRLKEVSDKIDGDVLALLQQNTANGVLVPNKVYLVGTKGYIVRRERIETGCRGVQGEYIERYHVYVETVDVA